MAFTTTTCTILNGATTSDAVDLQGHNLHAILFPTMTGTSVSFTATNARGGTYVAIQDAAGVALSLTTPSAKYVNLAPAAFAGGMFIKLVSGSAEGADRTIVLVLGDRL